MAAKPDDLKPITLEQLDEQLVPLHIRGQWHVKDDQFSDGPRPAGVPHVWKWAEIHPKLLDACIAMPESFTARRNFSFFNPELPGRGTTQTLLMGMQIAQPGEIAWAHRHSMGAIRFSILGNPGLYTVVDGEPLAMESGDLVLTPGWSWHDHHNDGDTTGIWLDVLDVPLVMGLGQPFFAAYGQSEQTRRPSESEYLSQRAGTLRPAWEQRPVNNYPLRYPWSDVAAALDRFAGLDGSPYEGIALEYVNPANGGPTLPSMSCSIQLLKPGFAAKMRRRTASAVYYVVEGEGSTVVGDQEISWTARDAFVVPNWSWHRHFNRSKSDRVILFCVTDEPLLSQLGLYREEPENTLRRASLPPLPSRAGKK